jgi:hypothetical protein
VRSFAAAVPGDRGRADALARSALEVADATDFLLLQADARATLLDAASEESVDRLREEAAIRYERKGARALADRIRS